MCLLTKDNIIKISECHQRKLGLRGKTASKTLETEAIKLNAPFCTEVHEVSKATFNTTLQRSIMLL